MYLNSETVNQLSVPFGVILGPITVAYNLVMLAKDIVKIACYSFLNRNYKPTEEYHLFKHADLVWEAQVSRVYKPRFNSDGTIEQDLGLFSDPLGVEIVNEALTNPLVSFGFTSVYKDLSDDDKREIELENSRRDFFHHVSSIAIGVIRSIPLIGGVVLCHYDVEAMNFGFETIA